MERGNGDLDPAIRQQIQGLERGEQATPGRDRGPQGRAGREKGNKIVHFVLNIIFMRAFLSAGMLRGQRDERDLFGQADQTQP